MTKAHQDLQLLPDLSSRACAYLSQVAGSLIKAPSAPDFASTAGVFSCWFDRPSVNADSCDGANPIATGNASVFGARGP